MSMVHVVIKNMASGEVYDEFDFDQSTGIDFAMGSNVGSSYKSPNQITHLSLELHGERVYPGSVEEQLSLELGV